MSANQKVTPYRNLDVDETGVVVSASPCKLSSAYIYNTSATDLYLKMYNKSTAATSADTPIATYVVPTRSGLVFNFIHRELPFNDGMSIRATTAIADNDTGAPAANSIVVNINTVENLSYTL